MSDLIPILDTHQHLIYSDRWPYSWTAGIPQLTGKTFHVEDYAKAVAGTGIAGAIFMESAADEWQKEARFIYELAAQKGSLIQAVIATCRPEDDGLDAYLDSIQNEKLVGLRRICHVEP